MAYSISKEVISTKITYLVNLILPMPGTTISAYSYKRQLLALGYSSAQASGSIGGCIRHGVLGFLNNGMLIRLK